MFILFKFFGKKFVLVYVIEDYNGFCIMFWLIVEGGSYWILVKIEKEVGGELKVYEMICVDMIIFEDEVVVFSVCKVKVFID